jgi:hypothetical protein
MEAMANSDNLNSTEEEIVSQVLGGITQDMFEEWGAMSARSNSKETKKKYF